MTIELPDNEIQKLHLTPERVRVELAVGLYAGRQVTLARATRIAGILYSAFLHELGRRDICIHYGIEDAQHDIRMAEELSRRAEGA